MKVSRVNSETYVLKNSKKIQTLDYLEKTVHRNCIYTKGVFDILHYGHLSLFSFLSELKEEYQIPLVVGISTDQIVKSTKGKDRPINTELNRTKQISLLPQVDYIHFHNEREYINVIQKLRPKIYIKGMDTALNNQEQDNTVFINSNPEMSYLDSSSLVFIFCDESEISTSLIINNIISAYNTIK